jgi:hypothetical protein
MMHGMDPRAIRRRRRVPIVNESSEIDKSTVVFDSHGGDINRTNPNGESS